MDIPFLLRRASRPQAFVCTQCTLKSTATRPIRRTISRKYVAKVEAAKEQWIKQKEEIEAGRKQSMLSILEERGYINSIAGTREELDQLLTSKRAGAYVGVDPTAGSLHVGHLLPFMALFWMYIHGFHSVSLLGSATAKVGDPTGRTTSRPVLQRAELTKNTVTIHQQLKTIWENVEVLARKHGYQKEWAWERALWNNSTWLNKVPITEVLKLFGTRMRMGSLLSRDTVKTKLESREGMSLAEFMYPLLQSWDWWHMYSSLDIQIQIGGSDQFGNIVTGIDAIKAIVKSKSAEDASLSDIELDSKPMGFTVPLLTTASGEKFGKSAGNAVWLDRSMMSSFDLYGFFMRTSDADVERYLKLFTFLPLETIQSLMKDHEKDHSLRQPHHVLAKEFVSLVHSKEAAEEAEQSHRNIFGRKNTLAALTSAGRRSRDSQHSGNGTPVAAHNAPNMQAKLPRSLIINSPLQSVLLAVGLVKSRSEGSRLMSAKGAYVGGRAGKGMGDDLSWTAVTDPSKGEAQKWLIDDKLLLLRVGKWNVRTIEVISDEEYEALGLPSHDVSGTLAGKDTKQDQEITKD